MLHPLTQSDIPAALEIAALQQRHSGTDAVSMVVLEEMLRDEVRDPGSAYEFYGYFEERKLVSWIGFRYGMLHGELAWCITNLFTRNLRTYFTWDPPELGLLIKKGFEVAEATKHYTYVYSIASRLERVYERKWCTNPWLPPSDRYTKEVLARVPAGEFAPENWMTRLARLPKTDDISILKRTLKPEYR